MSHLKVHGGKIVFVFVIKYLFAFRFWNAPAPGAKVLEISYEAYHCYTTGIIAILSGALLTLSGIGIILDNNFDIDFLIRLIPVQIPSAILGLLTISITPYKIYTFTHKDGNLFGFVGRAIAQMVLICCFWLLVFPDYFIVDYSESIFDKWLL